jgi:hypothetical protein
MGRRAAAAPPGPMKSYPPIFLALWLSASVSYASGAPATPPLKCTVTAPSGVFVAGFDYSTMIGAVTVDGAVGTRRFNVRAVPYNATYSLVFQGYGSGDHKPASESMKRMTSVVARLVAYGDATHLFFDSDYHAPAQAPTDGFVCQ